MYDVHLTAQKIDDECTASYRDVTRQYLWSYLACYFVTFLHFWIYDDIEITHITVLTFVVDALWNAEANVPGVKTQAFS